MSGIDLEHGVCPRCAQVIVLTDDGEIARHRLPAPRPFRFVGDEMVLGDWCVPAAPARPWRLAFVCCGREDGTQTYATYEEAAAARESYTSGPAVDPHGYSAAYPNGHVRAAIITREEEPAMGRA